MLWSASFGEESHWQTRILGRHPVTDREYFRSRRTGDLGYAVETERRILST